MCVEKRLKNQVVRILFIDRSVLKTIFVTMRLMTETMFNVDTLENAFKLSFLVSVSLVQIIIMIDLSSNNIDQDVETDFINDVFKIMSKTLEESALKIINQNVLEQL